MSNVVEMNPRYKEEMTIPEMMGIGIDLVVTLEAGMRDQELKEIIFVLEIGDIGYGLYALDHKKAVVFCDTIIDVDALNGYSLGEAVYNIVEYTYPTPRNIKVFATSPESCIYIPS